jgi:site-specific DNA recombinase
MKNRYISFGYCLSDGNIIAHDIEAEMVRLVFRQYIAGESYSRIAALLEKTGCPYNEGATSWNKNMVGRILQNRKYIGQDGYPTLVTEEEFIQSILLQQTKYTRKDIRTSPEVKVLKAKTICEECGQPYERIMDSRYGEKWKCKTSQCRTAVKITDSLLTEQVTALLNLAIENPDIIEIMSAEVSCHDIEITRLTNEINRQLDKTDCDEEYVKILIMARAAAQYGNCTDGLLPQRALEIKAAFEQSEPAEVFDTELFEYAVDRVLIRQDGTVSLTLKTGQYLDIERGGMPC